MNRIIPTGLFVMVSGFAGGMALAADPVECQTLRVTNPARYQKECVRPAPRPAPVPTRPSAPPIGIAPGQYRCKLSAEYALRPCLVTVQAGRATITVTNGLMFIAGELVPRGSGLQFTGRITDPNPYLCSVCATDTLRRSGYPTETQVGGTYSNGMCVPTSAEAVRQCKAQVLSATLRRSGKGWVGSLPITHFRNRYEHPRQGSVRIVGWDTEPDTLQFTVTR